MKVYYRMNEQLLEEFPNTGLDDVINTSLRNLNEKIKYQVMWALRSIEDTIKEENGIIIITEEGKIATKQFTPETTSKIHELLDKGFK